MTLSYPVDSRRCPPPSWKLTLLMHAAWAPSHCTTLPLASARASVTRTLRSFPVDTSVRPSARNRTHLTCEACTSPSSCRRSPVACTCDRARVPSRAPVARREASPPGPPRSRSEQKMGEPPFSPACSAILWGWPLAPVLALSQTRMRPSTLEVRKRMPSTQKAFPIHFLCAWKLSSGGRTPAPPSSGAGCAVRPKMDTMPWCPAASRRGRPPSPGATSRE
mmetsp:Transcript_104148/g.179444  ORF Transcript_104148/g.179444 Transcript_104148/m.179444 type:complete len:221 (+) Transcript_104148:132-794(+)